MSIITSLLDTDFYIFTMAQAILINYPDAWVKYKFKCRNFNYTLGKMNQLKFAKNIQEEINNFCDLSFKKNELDFLSRIPYFKSSFIRRLSIFKPEPLYITCEVINEELSITIEGPWFETIWFEVPVLAIISELYSQKHFSKMSWIEKLQNNLSNISKLDSGFAFAEGGTRRRFTKNYQQVVLQYLMDHHPNRLVGTSNVEFAYEFGLKPMGTMAHQWLQAHQALTNIRNSQIAALDVWARTYRGDLGIALSDVVGFDAFLQDFDKYFSKLFDGCRHDSGEPYLWTNNLIRHYENYGINPKTKTALFSDGLTFETMPELYKTYSTRINTAFLIGTELVGIPWKDYIAPQIVIKMVECNHQPVAKISDSSGKGMCEDLNYLNYVKNIFKINRFNAVL